MAGVIERIIEQFIAEHGEEPARFRHLNDDTARRAMIRDIAEYIFSVESLHLEASERAQIIRRAYDEIFGYGVLDELFADTTITTIAIDGAEKIAVRRGIGQELTPLAPIFDDTPHLQRILKRLLHDARAELQNDTPIMEIGLQVHGRPICINLVIPPITPHWTADIRLHPPTPITLQTLVDQNFVPSQLETCLRAILQSTHGFIILGDTESGKTTLLNALLNELAPTQLIAIERAGEMRLSDFAQSLSVQWTHAEMPGVSFGQQIMNALDQTPQTLVLDEVRADEPQALQPLLTDEATDTLPRLIWSFRGGAVTKRIQSALGQVARLAHPAHPESAVAMLHQRLPFLIILRRRQGRAQIRAIAEWQRDENGYANLVTLASVEDDGVQMTGITPRHILDLSPDFWRLR